MWYSNERLEFRADDGRLLRVENQRESEKKFLLALASAVWTTFKIAARGSFLAAIAALPFGMLAARNMHAPLVMYGSSRPAWC